MVEFDCHPLREIGATFIVGKSYDKWLKLSE